MAKPRRPGSRMIIWAASGIAVGSLLLGFFAWHIMSHAPQEGRDAAGDNRVVNILLPEGEVQGGIISRHTPPATLTTGGASAISALIPAPGEGLKPTSDMLAEQTSVGTLPRISPDGTKPWQYYGRAFKADVSKPAVAIVVTGLGLARDPTDAAMRLPAEVTLSFSPYAQNVDIWAAAARATGHEVLAGLPLEPANYPSTDPGPESLLTGQSMEVNEQHLRWVLSRFPAYVGVAAPASERFLQSREASRPVTQTLASRGLLLFLAATSLPDPVTEGLDHAELPYLHADVRLEAGMSHEEITTRLLEAERLATSRGHAIVVTQGEPVVLKELASWIEDIGHKGIILIPLSALARSKFS